MINMRNPEQKDCSSIIYRQLLSHLGSIEGFHDAVRTPYTLHPGRHVGFFFEQQNML